MKWQLVRATVEATATMREVSPKIYFRFIESRPASSQDAPMTEAYRQSRRRL
jgi:hypothetical protein